MIKIKKITTKLLLLLLVLIITACNSALPGQPISEPEEENAMPTQSDPLPDVEPIVFTAVDENDRAVLVKDNSDFAFDLYHQLKKESGNLLFSPYSISMALGMTYAGARSNTEQQMADVLNFMDQPAFHPAVAFLNNDLNSLSTVPDDSDEQAFKLNIANSIWGQEGYAFQDAFLDILSSYYGAGLQQVDYINNAEKARQQINAWIEKETNNKIKDLIPSGVLDSMTRLVLANAIYFNAAWQNQFLEPATSDAPFTLVDGTEISTPTMHLKESFAYADINGTQVIELPYQQYSASMIVILPERENFAEFESSLDAAVLQDMFNNLQSAEVMLSFPKFKYEAKLDLVSTLGQMGLRDPFNPQAADFSGMDGTRGLYISNILHKAFIDVDENGTEAAAATAVVMKLTSAKPGDPVEMKVDHPFIYLIKDNKTNTILFMGRVMDPR